MLREIVLDTETTGLSITEKHRLIEIGCVELVNRVRTGVVFHKMIDPQRLVSAEAFNVHGLSNEMLEGKPLFKDIAQEFLDFIADSTLVIHNAKFDVKFLNNELESNGFPIINKNRVIDSLDMARRKFPGKANSLDALCKRLSVSLASREKHGALIDSELLALVYIKMRKEKIQNKLFSTQQQYFSGESIEFPKREFPVSKDELREHEDMRNKYNFTTW